MGFDDDDPLAQVRACVATLDELLECIDEFSESELADAMVTLLRLHSRSEQLATLVARRARERGDVKASDAANTTQWVANCANTAAVPLDVRDAHTIASVADACQGENARVVTEALRVGSCTPAVAKTALQEAAKVAPVVPEADRDQVLGWFLDLDPASGAAGRRLLTRQILAMYAPDELDKSDATLERTESLSWWTTETGMTRLTAELAPVNAAIVKEAVMALSAPRTGRDADGRISTDAPSDGSQDERTPGKRRVDALVTLVSSAARLRDVDAAGLGSAARVTVTMPLDTLTAGLDSATTSTGDLLDPGAARRLACDADIMPAVLGTESEPLDVGRTKRLVPKGLRTAVTLRDNGCTFPGCDRPPQFCEVHHIVPWSAGGVTSLLNSAMLCTTHHQKVHRSGYTAVATAARVEWDLTAARTTGSRSSDAA
ncbi:MAG TPA: DUF222 domain-containing protein [Flexivirga sp.]|uniref:HNH endonuclease signature motif containing protein n=1 Tax=Flexivirga sp. TaxID=1962927 RepID=UPI002C2CAEF1|nr:DUF222 domain-containing protein [Flexivirga sp.]HWC23180.1 DUF222 domain-containing protein [Flexivirga sp.]